jgi:dolichol-phosphate mannosyltransferase
MAELTVVVPVFNEGLSLQAFHERLAGALAQLDLAATVLYVNDGSTDKTQEVLDRIAASDSRVHVLELSRNFGHQAALSAGLEQAQGALIVMMDGDGQHPPELIPEMLRLHSLGYDIVQGQRVDKGMSGMFWKNATSRLFYRLLSNIGEIDLPPGSSDFRLITAEVLEALRSLPEYHRFIRGMVSWIGFRSVLLPYRPQDRASGETKYSARKMLRLAGDGVFSFSLVPLRLGLMIGAIFFLLGLAETAYVLSFWLDGRQRVLVPGWSSLVLLVTFSNASLMILLGFIGVYVGMIFQEVKRRPVYVVRKARNARPAARREENETDQR